MTAPSYDAAFYDRAEQSENAARSIVPIVRSFARIESVLDVGCARGTWLSAWGDAGCIDCVGIDGAYVRRDDLVIDPACFVRADLSSSFRLGRRFDCVQCLEVAEHLPRTRNRSLVADLVHHADVVLFSAAPPGQGGEFHINEQPYDVWRALFLEHDYIAFDYMRPRILHMKAVPYWYRHNMMIYVNSTAIGRLSPQARHSRLPPDTPVPDVAPLGFRARRRVLRLLPASAINCLARMNARVP